MKNDFKVASVILGAIVAFAGCILTKTVSEFAGKEHELMIFAVGMTFLAAGWFFGIGKK